MTKRTSKQPVMFGMILGITVLLSTPSGKSFPAATAQPGNKTLQIPAPKPPSTPAVGSISGQPAVLDAHRRLALGMIETGNRDDEIGGAGEVSRYQIMPSVWRQYSNSQNYRNPDVSLSVAQKHWAWLYTAFVKQAHRQPTDFDMYVLWNTHFGYYASRGFNPNRLSANVRERAQRYVNLVCCNDF